MNNIEEMNNNEGLFLKRIQENNNDLFFQSYKNNDLKTMKWCLDSGICTDLKDNEFIQICSEEDRLEVLKLLHKYNWYGQGEVSFSTAVQRSNWEMMKWLYEMGYSKDSDPQFLFSEDLEIMQWLKDRGIEFNKYTLEWAEDLGWVENIKWLKKNI